MAPADAGGGRVIFDLLLFLSLFVHKAAEQALPGVVCTITVEDGMAVDRCVLGGRKR